MEDPLIVLQAFPERERAQQALARHNADIFINVLTL
jgi:hypothetical protein